MGNLFPFKLLNEKVRKNIKFDRKVLLMVESGENCPTVFFPGDDSWWWYSRQPSKTIIFLVSFLACFGTKKTHDEMPPQERQCMTLRDRFLTGMKWILCPPLSSTPNGCTQKNIRWRLQCFFFLFSVIDKQQATTKTSWLPTNKQGKQQGVGFCHHLNL